MLIRMRLTGTSRYHVKEVRHADIRDLFTTIGYCWLFIDRVSHRPEKR